MRDTTETHDVHGSMKVMTVVGARPQFVKAAAVSRALAASASSTARRITEVVVHTGQHYDYQMSDVFFADLQMAMPSYQLGVGSGTHGAQTGAMMTRLEEVAKEIEPDVVLVYGDTNSTLAAALVAAKMGIPIAHVEAGLRSFDRSMPEEINRVLTDHVASMLFCPSMRAVEQLTREGIVRGVEMVGDVMLDVFRSIESRLPSDNQTAAKYGIDDGYFVATVHRPVNTDDPAALERICAAFDILAAAGETVIWPVHPRLRGQLDARFAPASIHLIEPVGYVEMLMLLRGSRAVLTDSGGLQKEALWSGKPCVTIRTTTEWVETVEAGWNLLVGNDRDRLADGALHFRPSGAPPQLYGNGDASTRIVDSLLRTTRPS